jgi:hypothetical protein
MFKQRHGCAFVTFIATGFFATGLLFTELSGPLCAQSQSDSSPSVAEAARRAREQKKNAAKPVRTFTNEDLPASPATPPSTNAENTTNTDTNSAKSEKAPSTTSETSETRSAQVNDEDSKRKKSENAAALERAKKDLLQAQDELGVLQRKAVLDSESYYSKTDFASDKDGKANLDAEAQQINDKQQAVDALKARVAELQALLGEPADTESEKNPPNR